MATIRTRQRKDGSLAYLSEVRVKRDGEIVHRESRAFDRRAQAEASAESPEKKFAKESPTSLPMCDQSVSLAPALPTPTMTLSGCE